MMRVDSSGITGSTRILLNAAPLLVRNAPLDATARRAGHAAALWLLEGTTNESGYFAPSVLEIGTLVAAFLARDQQVTGCIEATGGDGAQPAHRPGGHAFDER